MPSPRALQEPAVRYFLEVVKTGSVKEAALKLNVAPSAVSRQVARLERELDTLLFERHARGMVPNAAGELLAAHAKRAQQDIERVANDIAGLRGLRTGHVRVASTEGFAFDFIPRLIAQFRLKHAGIRFHLEVCAPADISRLVRDGEADVGITLAAWPEPGVEVELRHPSPILAVMAMDHPLAQQRQLSLRQVVAYPLGLPQEDSSIRRLLDASCSRQELRYELAMSSNHANSLLSFAAAGGGSIAFYGPLSIRTLLQSKALVAIPLKDREMHERHLAIETMAGRSLPDAARAFVRFLVDAVKASG
ncbi:LysR family transcriptional regulator [Variovorax sp. NFACC27]|uniref:LysR family transcriptional regulator n=1 Tax=unclassified Variovorax TaxID=663243 RepID=UPI000894BC91|nr:DNA-binding transcriptional regulator, LysR family [Variovorax sp. NFACC28]SEG97984.1 DNA-binding transcriptional regulator, LysR family [Variovorax sp. NFACC29]SFE02533.1 DNA-binding transcriptional regulator, LysR family [Variovorax sp. NFACC26]SFH20964.1 DNA-binding transcriptional regulator, LysR family [Variovorax sp. NFACC27]